MSKIVKKRGQTLKKRISRSVRTATENSKEHIKENFFDRLSHVKHIRLFVLEWALLVSVIIIVAVAQAFWYPQSYAVTSWGEGGTYTEATLGKVNSLNPLFASTDSEKTLSKLMFATLSAPDYSGHTGLDLASSIRTDDSGLTWTVKLRENAKWSDGEPITNADVLFTVGLLQDPNINSAYSSNLTNVKVEEKDGALTFTLPAIYANFSSALNFPILPKHALENVDASLLLEDNFSVSPITSGPFSYNASQAIGTTGEKIVYLTPNKAHYNGAPLLDSFAVHAYTSADDILSAINSGSVTATAALAPTDVEEITSPQIYEKQTAISSGVFAFMNTTDGPLSDKTLRKAIQEGVNMTEFRAELGDEPALDYPLLKSQLELSNYPALPSYDLEDAKSKVESVEGAADHTLTIATVDTGYFPTLAESLKTQLEQIGLKAEVQTYDSGQDFLLAVVRPRDYDILIYEVELGADPDLFAYYHSSQATSDGLNLSNFNNTLASDLLLAARGTMDQEVKDAKYEAFLKIWVDEAPALGIYQSNMSYYVNKNVRSFSEDNRLITPVDRFTDVSIWATEKVRKNRTP